MKKYLIAIALVALALIGTLAVTLDQKQEEPRPISLAEFNSRVANKDKVVLVYFHADWCKACSKMLPVIEKIKADYLFHLEVLSIDTERDTEITDEFEINSLPLIVIYKNGTAKWSNTGVISESELRIKLGNYVVIP